MLKNKENKQGLKVANQYYNSNEDSSKDEVSKGLNTVHEQINDAYNGNPEEAMEKENKEN